MSHALCQKSSLEKTLIENQVLSGNNIPLVISLLFDEKGSQCRVLQGNVVYCGEMHGNVVCCIFKWSEAHLLQIGTDTLYCNVPELSCFLFPKLPSLMTSKSTSNF